MYIYVPNNTRMGFLTFELNSGSCVFHQGGTLHYNHGNSTANKRRALITNFRPKAIIQLEREKGVEHTLDREVRK